MRGGADFLPRCRACRRWGEKPSRLTFSGIAREAQARMIYANLQNRGNLRAERPQTAKPALYDAAESDFARRSGKDDIITIKILHAVALHTARELKRVNTDAPKRQKQSRFALRVS